MIDHGYLGHLPDALPHGPDDDAAEREHVAWLDRALHQLWDLGRNIILVWTPNGRGMDVLVIPHYLLVEFASRHDREQANDPDALLGDDDPRNRRSESFIESIISREKRVPADELTHLSRLLGYEPRHLELPFTPDDEVPGTVIEALVKRYSISYIEDRAVALFDIVGFSLFSPLEQVTQLNSLSYSVNAAYSRMLSNNIDISFARTTTGDGFYIWNRDRSIQANVNLYHFMHLVLADNAVARRKSKSNTTPLLRACFHVGGHYEFYQSEGLSPTIYSYIVGDVTIDLARMIDRALPGQVLVGDFWVPMPDWERGRMERIDTLQFIDRTHATLSSLRGLVLSGDSIESIKCYLTGEQQPDGRFGVKKYQIADKHGRIRSVYNAKINIYRNNAEPIFLGRQSRDLDEFETAGLELVEPPEGLI